MSTLLTPEDWERLQEIFDVAVALDREERSAYLDETCGESSSLRRSLESLLRSSDAATRVGHVIGSAAVAVLDASLPAVGSLLGAYRITGILGRGGMGVVYRAVRADDQYQKEVAIKAASVGLLTPELRERFVSERQILASLDHPNIARLLDGGTTHEGVQYVVMEFVSGKPIHTYCEEAGLGRRERIQLIIDVAMAVDYAHRHLIVHRDLKPDNILVTAEGTPKLLDFGIAKVLDPQVLGLSRSETLDAMRLLTPDYASPEQIRGEAITTSTDVYQIGILAYLLLTGRRVFQAPTGRMSELERMICETSPPKPNLEKDLDLILLHALEKEPGRRYASAGALAEDLKRYLDGFPVEASPSSWMYRAGKFVRRHTLSVAAASLAAVLILSFGIGMAILAKRLAHQRDVAETNLHRAERVSEFMESVFRQANPSIAQGASPTAKDLLDRGAAQIDRSLAEEPQVKVRLWDTFGTAYTEMGLYKQSEELLLRSLALRRKLYGNRSVEVAECLVNTAEAGLRSGDNDRAVAMAKEAVAQYTALRGRISRETATATDTLAMAQYFRSSYGEAGQAARDAIDIWEKLEGPDTLKLHASLNLLAAVMQTEGNYAVAESLYRRQIDAFHKAGKNDQAALSDIFTKLGETLTLEGRVEEAEALERQALASRQKVYGRKHSYVGLTENALARTLLLKGQLDEAERLLQDALAVHLATVGPISRYASMDENVLGLLYEKRGNLGEAARYQRQAVEAREQLLGGDSPYVVRAKVDLARVLIEQGHLEEAAQVLASVAAIQEKSAAANPRDKVDYLVAMSRLQSARRQDPEAEESLREALALSKAKVPLGIPAMQAIEKELNPTR